MPCDLSGPHAHKFEKWERWRGLVSDQLYLNNILSVVLVCPNYSALISLYITMGVHIDKQRELPRYGYYYAGCFPL